MAETNERLDAVEQRLDKVEQRLGSVETGLTRVSEEVGGLRGEVNQLRILGETNTEDIKKIAEVQSHHGRMLREQGTKLDAHGKKLDEIREPLSRIEAFVTAVAHDHEERLKLLEKGSRGLS